MSVGCTCTIIYGLFMQYGIDLPDNIAEIDFGAFDFGVSFTYKGINFDNIYNLCTKIEKM